MAIKRQPSGFENLEVFKLAEQLADLVWQCVKGWNLLGRDTLGKQMIRSADSVGANIVEGYGRGSAADNRRFVRIAVGSLYETKYWLRRAHARNLLNQQQVELIRPVLDRLLPMLNGYLRSIGK